MKSRASSPPPSPPEDPEEEREKNFRTRSELDFIHFESFLPIEDFQKF